jgi:hypothetical protein
MHPREHRSSCYKMVTSEAHTSPLRIEGTSDIPARSPSSVLRVPFPIASNMVPSHCSLGSCVSIHCLLEVHRISYYVQPHGLVLFPDPGYWYPHNRGYSSQPKGFAWTSPSDRREGCRLRRCSAGCTCSRSQVNRCTGDDQSFSYRVFLSRVLYVLMMYVSVCELFFPRVRPFSSISSRPDRHECPLDQRIRGEFVGCVRGR